MPGNCTYLNGNSLGPLPLRARHHVSEVLRQWEQLGVEGWWRARLSATLAAEEMEASWFELAEKLAPALARIVGAEPKEVIATGTITQNLHQLLATFYAGNGDLLATSLDFPSDSHVLRSWARRLGKTVRLVPAADDGYSLDPKVIEDMLAEPGLEVAVLPTVLYRSGQLLDVQKLSKIARDNGVFLIWDAAHSAGIVDHHFHDDEVDAAVWCNYKYLSGGPGCPGAVFLHSRHHEEEAGSGASREAGLPGWWGNDKATQFEMRLAHEPAGGAWGLQTGTPCIVGLAALAGALEVFEDVDMEEVRRQSLRMSDYLYRQIRRLLPEVVVETPMRRYFNPWWAASSQRPARGGHVAFRHPRCREMSEALQSQFGVICDFRPPSTIRLCPHPFYTTEDDIEHAVRSVRRLLDGAPER